MNKRARGLSVFERQCVYDAWSVSARILESMYSAKPVLGLLRQKYELEMEIAKLRKQLKMLNSEIKGT